MGKVKDVVLVHPGAHLLNDYLRPLKISQNDFGKHIGLSKSTISRLVNGKIIIGGKLAFLIGKATKTDAIYWLDLQREFELASAKKDRALSAAVKKVKVLPGL